MKEKECCCNCDYGFKTPIFTEEMKKNYTILTPDIFPLHLELVVRVFRRYGYKVEILHTRGKLSSTRDLSISITICATLPSVLQDSSSTLLQAENMILIKQPSYCFRLEVAAGHQIIFGYYERLWKIWEWDMSQSSP